MEYWLNEIIVGEEYKLKSVELVEVNKSIDTFGELFENAQVIKISWNELLELYKNKNNKFMNVEALTEDSITLSKKSYNVFEFTDSLFYDDEPSEDANVINHYPENLLSHSVKMEDKKVLDDDKTLNKLKIYVNKLKTLGIYDDYNILVEYLTLVDVEKFSKEFKMPPVRVVRFSDSVKRFYDSLETLIFSDETTMIKFPFKYCRNLKTLIFGKNTRDVYGFYGYGNGGGMRLDTLDIGGAFEIPILNNKSKTTINHLTVSTRCKLQNALICPLYFSNVDVKHLTIKEFKQ